MRQSMTIRLDQDVLKVAKLRAKAVNRTLTNYIETLIRTDIASGPRSSAVDPVDIPVEVFIAEPLADRLVTDPRSDDAAEDAAGRQEYLDLISGWSRTA